jgi:hypothetical protein
MFNLKISIFEANFALILTGFLANLFYPSFDSVFNTIGFFCNIAFGVWVFKF